MKTTLAFLLASVYPKLLWLTLTAWCVLLPAALARLRLRKGTGVVLAAIVLGALALRLAAGPAHRVYNDEFEHLDISRHLAATGSFATTLAGGLADYDVLGRPTWPGGHHAGLAVAFVLFGANAATAFAWSALLSSLSALFVFWAAREMFDDEKGALAAAFAWAVLPLAVRYGTAADLTSSTVFWIAASLAALHARENTAGRAMDAFAAVTLAYTVQVRPENALIIIYAAALRAPLRVWLPALIGAIFPIGIALANRSDALPGYSSATTSPIAHTARHFLPNLRYFASRPEFWVMLIPAGLAACFKLRATRLAALGTAFFLLYGGFFRGRFDTGTEDRYALTATLPLYIAAPAVLGPAAVPTALLAVGLSWGAPAAPDQEHERARLFLERSASLIPDRVYVAAFNPSFVREVAGRPAAWTYLLLEDLPGFEAARKRADADSRLVLYKDWAWRSRPADAARLEDALSGAYDSAPLATNGVDSLILLTPR